MMNGVEVLTQTEIMAKNPIIETVGIIATILMVIFVLIALFALIDNKDILSIVAAIIAGVTITASIVCAILWETALVSTGEYEYQVTVDDSVSMNEFYEKYEVISVEGKIYTIRLKNVD